MIGGGIIKISIENDISLIYDGRINVLVLIIIVTKTES
jgi:hypothetical protein